jgi:uncharacterized membrane protein
MRTRLLHVWKALVYSLWFFPALMVCAAVVTSFAALKLDWTLGDRAVPEAVWIWNGGPEGARAIVSTIAGSMMTVTGVVFSITVVVLVLASSQFGPRLLRNFMRDTGTKVVMGTFLATFTYSLLVLRAIRSEDGSHFAAPLSVTGAIILALVSLAVLIYFIEHVAASIQAPVVIAKVSDEVDRAIERMFPEKLGDGRPRKRPVDSDLAIMRGRPSAIPSSGTGYLQAVDQDGLLEMASSRDIIMELRYRPGEFIVAGTELARVWQNRSGASEIADELNSHFFLGVQRTEEQDIEFTVDQLVEVAVRALSPGINDPFTAMNSVDRLGAALCRLASREIPSPYRYDSADRLRVIAPAVGFPDLMDAAFNQIRQYGRSSTAVSIRLLEALAVLARHVKREEDRLCVAHHAKMIHNASGEAATESSDREEVETRYRAVAAAAALEDNEAAIEFRHEAGGT